MKRSEPITEGELHAYADGRLPAPRQLEVAAYLAGQPEERQRVEAWMRDNAALRERFAAVMQEPIPMRIPTRRPASLPWRRAAASIALVAAGLALGWFLRGAVAEKPARIVATPALAARAAMAHAVYTPEVRRPVEVGAQEEAQLVTWLSRRLEAPIKAPRLRELGFELMGGRLLPGERGPAAQLMYHDSGGRRLTLYVAREQPHTADVAFRFDRSGEVNTFYWIDGAFGYAISANVPRAELHKLALEIHGQLAAR